MNCIAYFQLESQVVSFRTIAAEVAAYPTIGPQPIPVTTSSFLGLQEPVGWTLNSSATPIQDVRVDHGRTDIAVTEQLLHGPDIVSIFQQMGGERMSQRMT